MRGILEGLVFLALDIFLSSPEDFLNLADRPRKRHIRNGATGTRTWTCYLLLDPRWPKIALESLRENEICANPADTKQRLSTGRRLQLCNCSPGRADVTSQTALLSNVPDVVANSWWSPSSLAAWLNEECYSADSAPTRKLQETLRRFHPRGPMSTASEALAGAGKPSRNLSSREDRLTSNSHRH